jgi:hypothetical protein
MILEGQKYGTKVLKDYRITRNEGIGGAEVYLRPFLTLGKEFRYPLCTRWA